MNHRPRRLRRTDALRSMVRETRLTRDDFVLPLFVCPGNGVRREISSMPGVYNLSIDETTQEVAAAYEAGVRSIILFGLPESKDRSEEHTSELQSRLHLVCRLLLEKKKKHKTRT